MPSRFVIVVCIALAGAVLAAGCTLSGNEDRPEANGSDIVVPPWVTDGPNGHVDHPSKGWYASGCDLPFELVRRIKRGYYPGRSPDLLFTANIPTHYSNSHSGPWDYLSEVPLLLYGPGFIRARGSIEADREATLADLAPTFAELLGTPFPGKRAGKPLEEALIPEAQRPNAPKLIVTVVWDGGGMSGLDAHPDAWPVLQALTAEGTFFEGADTGSSPTITPATHANIGTGTFPNQHGVVDIKIVEDGRFQGTTEDNSPSALKIETFADIYDQRTGNRSKVGVFAYKTWHEAMIGLGAGVEGGDRDIAALVNHDSRLFANRELYRLPEYLKKVKGLNHFADEVDRADGKADGKWLGHDRWLEDRDLIRKTPAWALYQTKIIKRLIEREGFGKDDVPDLFFTNYKQIDEVGHQWSMHGKEMGEVIEYTDAQLGILKRFLDRTVGKNQWVMAVTADHGPAPDVDVNGGWQIRLLAFLDDMAEHFGVTREQLEIDHRVGGNWPRPETLAERGFNMADIANYVIQYRIEDNADGSVPEGYEKRKDEPLFAAAWPATKLDKVYRCSKKRSGG